MYLNLIKLSQRSISCTYIIAFSLKMYYSGIILKCLMYDKKSGVYVLTDVIDCSTFLVHVAPPRRDLSTGITNLCVSGASIARQWVGFSRLLDRSSY